MSHINIYLNLIRLYTMNPRCSKSKHVFFVSPVKSLVQA